MMQQTNNNYQNIISQLQQENTELKKKVAELETDVTTDEAILQAIGDGLVVVDMDKTIVMVNAAFERLLGWNANEVLGKKFTDIIIKQNDKGEIVESKQRFKKIDSFIAHQGGYLNYYYVRKNGTRFPVDLTTSPIVMNGEQIGIVQIFSDITEEKEIEKSKNQFVSLASHQLRTPLSSINWYSESMYEGDVGQLNQDQATYINEIIHASRRMTNIVNSLINISRLEMNTIEVKPIDLDLQKLIVSILNKFKSEIKKRKLKIIWQIQPGLEVISMDKNITQTILNTLISNSIKYSFPKTEIKIQIFKDNSKNLYLQINNAGFGIPEDEQNKIFTKLFRASNIKKVDTDGTGVGLYIAKEMLKLIKGEIWFESIENKETTFYVKIPLEKS
ncbi:PAS domain S-box protein [Candidatus Dojkabacteria bacterium]|nr:PAS domain S-box protein [Candidatus Dojkabacteria bacterium]